MYNLNNLNLKKILSQYMDQINFVTGFKVAIEHLQKTAQVNLAHQ